MAKKEKKEDLVLMRRDTSTNPAPHEATVHPSEVANWQKYGWEIVKEAK
jgi:hypothetical protein